MKRALILGGTGVLGRATARRLLAEGWNVDLTGRNWAKMPATLEADGTHFITADRHNAQDLAAALGAGADLVVDAACYSAAHARMLLPLLKDVDAAVMLSSKAVYVDDAGNHVNSAVAPRFTSPITELNPTMEPGHGTYQSREGYGANKVAAEQVFLDSGAPVTIVRASKVHGEGAVNPREWMFVKRILDKRRFLLLADGGRGGDHTTAAANTAALISVIAHHPGRRILNSADPDAPTGLEIARIIASQLGHAWDEVLLGPEVPMGLGEHPWNFTPPIVLDTRAAESLGYVPAGNYGATIRAEIHWLMATAANRPPADDPAFADFTDYALEDSYLRSR